MQQKTPQRSGHIVPELITQLWQEAQQTINRTETQIGALVSRLVEKGTVSQDEGSRAFADTLRAMRKSREEMASFMDLRLETMCRALRIPTRTEVESLRDRVAQLRRRVDKLGKKVG